MTQQKKQPRKLKDWDEVDKALERIAVIDELNKKQDADYNAKEQERRLKITEAQQPFHEEKKSLEQSLEDYAFSHKDEMGDKKTMQLNHGKVYFRSTPPAVGLLSGFDWLKVTGLIKKSVKWATRFIRTKEDIDKTEIKKAATKGEIKPKELSALGMVIESVEHFGYDATNALR